MADSTRHERLTVRTEAVPADSAGLEISLDSLLKLPAGAVYRKQSGRASVTVGKGEKAGTIYVFGTCDSLQRLVESYELREQARRVQTDSVAQASKATVESSVKETKRAARPWLWCALAFIAGVVAGIVITLKMKKRK